MRPSAAGSAWVVNERRREHWRVIRASTTGRAAGASRHPSSRSLAHPAQPTAHRFVLPQQDDSGGTDASHVVSADPRVASPRSDSGHQTRRRATRHAASRSAHDEPANPVDPPASALLGARHGWGDGRVLVGKTEWGNCPEQGGEPRSWEREGTAVQPYEMGGRGRLCPSAS